MNVESIELTRLIPHLQNANVMDAETMKKVRTHIERTGHYEPLVVRPHPIHSNKYELINGHHRSQILSQLGHTHANCIVWDLDDRETLLLLATVNRLSGADAPGKRLSLLESLEAALKANAESLAALLPEDAELLKKLLDKSPLPAITPPPLLGEMKEAFVVFLTHDEKASVVARLREIDANASRALVRLVQQQSAA